MFFFTQCSGYYRLLTFLKFHSLRISVIYVRLYLRFVKLPLNEHDDDDDDGYMYGAV